MNLIKINGAIGPLTTYNWPGIQLDIAHQGNVPFDDIDKIDSDVLPGRSTVGTKYVEANADGTMHVLPHHAALPTLHGGTWNLPSPEKLAVIRKIIGDTSHMLDIEKPEWSRIKRFLDFHKDDNLPFNGTSNAELAKTDMGWLQRNFHHTHGGPERFGWYHAANFRTGGNGLNNYHNDQIWNMMVAIVLEPIRAKQEQMWPYFMEAAVNHLCYGRFWSGPNKGAARDEKGNTYVGDSGRVPFSKQFVSNLIAGYLMTDSHPVFESALRNCADWWTALPSTVAWKGFWGSRQGARDIRDNAFLALTLPDLRPSMVRQIKEMLNTCDTHLDRNAWVWPNDGNGGDADEKGWMATQLVFAIFQARELLPELVGFGPSVSDLNKIIAQIFSDYGSENIGGYRCVRYTYHTHQSPARFISSTATSVPALRYLEAAGYEWASAQLAETMELIQLHAGNHIRDLRNGISVPETDIGFRYPPQGGSWPKTVEEFIWALG